MHSPQVENLPGHPQPVIVPRAEHPISRANISPNALKVLYRLKDAGYQAFLVGGAVRDLLLGLEPKDFDIATNAHPGAGEQLFRNCRLIGRRFHLAHVRFGMEIIEVATFRAAHTQIDEDNSVDEAGHRVLDEGGRILRDNLYGTIEEDVWRRDFTANGLYYNIEDFSIWDYVGGVADANARVLRLIGDPETRYREDPVRMLRAMRFAAKLDFTLHPDTAAPIPARAHARQRAARAPVRRSAEDVPLRQRAQELRHAGEARPARAPVPGSRGRARRSRESRARELVRLGLDGHRPARARRQAGDADVPVRRAAVARDQARDRRAGRSLPEIQALQTACDTVTSQQMRRVAIPKRFTLPMRELIGLQPRFDKRDGRRALRLLDHPRFRAAYDFLLLRVAAGEVDPEVGEWWTQIQTLPEEQRVGQVEAGPARRAMPQPPRDAPSRRRRRRPAAT